MMVQSGELSHRMARASVDECACSLDVEAGPSMFAIVAPPAFRETVLELAERMRDVDVLNAR
jgi:hypothetical protein